MGRAPSTTSSWAPGARRTDRAVRRLMGLPGFGPLVRRRRRQQQIRPDDAYLISYPRSGSTWLRYILAQIHPDFPLAAAPSIDHVIPAVAAHAKGGYRLIKSHDLYTPLFPRVVYLLRDGRAATRSSYDYARGDRPDAPGAFLRYLRSPTGSQEDYYALRAQWPSRWHEHVESWLRPSSTPILLVRYERMRQDPMPEVLRVLDFLGWPVPTEAVEAAVENASIERMRAVEASGRLGSGHRGLYKVGQGTIEVRADLFPPEALDCFTAYAGPTLHRMGYLLWMVALL
jgi:estrone sulfotransferase